MKRMVRVTAIFEREGDLFVGRCPDFEVASQGSTVEEARANLLEALGLLLETASEADIAERLHAEVYVTTLDVTIDRPERVQASVVEAGPGGAEVPVGPLRGR
jgi:predicted RNase H-like HicB family nuclease